MTTYNIREFKAKVSEILSALSYGEEVIITRRGKPCGRLSPIQNPTEEKPSLSTLKGSFTGLPEASYGRLRGDKGALGTSGPVA